ncbi:unnamed protein product [Blepharisma stoltei]|uniref:OB domain-containing protein n=1 Tax=Blepharisma stoltei TaxID=1481888 RepID=A0AAU9IJB7_9CILI|nr:unnamed protein product [Blepharisma stoltei]
MESNAGYGRFQTERKSQQYLPCTLSMLTQISKSEDETFKWYDRSLDTIETVGWISEIQETALRFEFKLKDSFGEFSAVIYKKGDEKPSIMRDEDFKEGEYVHITGNLRKFHDNVSVVLTSIEKLDKRTQVDEFLARVVWAHIKLNQPPVQKIQVNVDDIILQAIQKANPGKNPRGVTDKQIKDQLDAKIDNLPDHLQRMLSSGIIEEGKGWGCYSIKN